MWVVEDSAPDVYLIQLALKKTGIPMELKLFSDGDVAMAAVQACCDGTGIAPDIVLLDLHLPRTDGIEILRGIRRAPRMSKVRVAVFGQPHNLASSPAADCYLRKPGDLDEFVAEIGSALRQLSPAK